MDYVHWNHTVHKISLPRGTCEISQLLANNARSEGHSCTDVQFHYYIIWVKEIRQNCTTLLSITPSHVGKSGAEFLFNRFLEIQGTHPNAWGIRIICAYFKEASCIWNNCFKIIPIYPNFNALFIHSTLKFSFLLFEIIPLYLSNLYQFLTFPDV